MEVPHDIHDSAAASCVQIKISRKARKASRVVPRDPTPGRVQPFVGAADPHRKPRGDGNPVNDDDLRYI